MVIVENRKGSCIVGRVTLLMLLCLNIWACKGSSNDNGYSLSVPESIRTVRALEYANVGAEIEVNGGAVQTFLVESRGGTEIYLDDVILDAENIISILWFEEFQSTRLNLSRQEGRFFADSESGALNRAGFEHDIRFDTDGDGEFNLTERQNGTCPLTFCEPTNLLRLSTLSAYGPDLYNADQLAIQQIADVTNVASLSRDDRTVEVELYRFETPLTFRSLIDFYKDDFVIDSCDVAEVFPLETPGNFLPVDVGPSIAINGSSGASFELDRELARFEPNAYENYSLPAVLPEGATLFIPGTQEFSTLNYPLISVGAAVTGISYESDVETGVVFKWIPDNDESTLIFLNAELPLEEILDLGETVELDCVMHDDGEFRLPPAIISQLVTYGPVWQFSIGRFEQRLEYVNGAGVRYVSVEFITIEPPIEFQND